MFASGNLIVENGISTSYDIWQIFINLEKEGNVLYFTDHSILKKIFKKQKKKQKKTEFLNRRMQTIKHYKL